MYGLEEIKVAAASVDIHFLRVCLYPMMTVWAKMGSFSVNFKRKAYFCFLFIIVLLSKSRFLSDRSCLLVRVTHLIYGSRRKRDDMNIKKYDRIVLGTGECVYRHLQRWASMEGEFSWR